MEKGNVKTFVFTSEYFGVRKAYQKKKMVEATYIMLLTTTTAVVQGTGFYSAVL